MSRRLNIALKLSQGLESTTEGLSILLITAEPQSCTGSLLFLWITDIIMYFSYAFKVGISYQQRDRKEIEIHGDRLFYLKNSLSKHFMDTQVILFSSFHFTSMIM